MGDETRTRDRVTRMPRAASHQERTSRKTRLPSWLAADQSICAACVASARLLSPPGLADLGAEAKGACHQIGGPGAGCSLSRAVEIVGVFGHRPDLRRLHHDAAELARLVLQPCRAARIPIGDAPRLGFLENPWGRRCSYESDTDL
jgi:hypothetical protein